MRIGREKGFSILLLLLGMGNEKKQVALGREESITEMLGKKKNYGVLGDVVVEASWRRDRRDSGL